MSYAESYRAVFRGWQRIVKECRPTTFITYDEYSRNWCSTWPGYVLLTNAGSRANATLASSCRPSTKATASYVLGTRPWDE